eukprot:gene3923-2790_t
MTPGGCCKGGRWAPHPSVAGDAEVEGGVREGNEFALALPLSCTAAAAARLEEEDDNVVGASSGNEAPDPPFTPPIGALVIPVCIHTELESEKIPTTSHYY